MHLGRVANVAVFFTALVERRASDDSANCVGDPLSQLTDFDGVAAAVEGAATLEEIGDLALKGLSQAVAVYNVARE